MTGEHEVEWSRSEHKRHSQQWLDECLADPAARFLPLLASTPLVEGSPPKLAWLERGTIAAQLNDRNRPLLLGLRNGAPRFTVSVVRPEKLTFQPAPGRRFIDLREVMGSMSPQDVAVVSEAISVAFWNSKAHFCGACGVVNTSLDGGYRRICPKCQGKSFTRIDPVAIMAVHKGDRCVLGRAANQPDSKRFTCLGGHNHPGESIEDTVRREVQEEVGLEVDDVRYHSSQPWPFKHKLMLGFHARALADEIVVEKNELLDARWFSRGEVKLALEGKSEELNLPPAHTIANRLLRSWVSWS